jgi:hypothetical protein
MVDLTAPVDDNGNININNQEKVVIDFFFEVSEGVPRDMTGRTLNLEVEGAVVIALTNGPETNQMQLTILPEALDGFLDRVVDYIVIDRTADIDEIMAEGRLTVRGWA